MRPYLFIFGSTGNLMYKKLLPAISSLLTKKLLPENLKILAVGRRDWTLEEYIEDAKDQTTAEVDWENIVNHIEYVKMDINTVSDYKKLASKITEKDALKLVYLAVPPKLISPIAKGIYEGGLVEKGNKSERIVFEKPFGEDLKSAKEINQMLWSYFDESQLYRIDHYLGKEMIQNILTVRFANRLFQESWSNKAIESVTLIAKESEGVLSRAAYYDKVGAIKDMVQSHLIQMAAMIAMEDPESLNANDVRNKKVEAIKHLSFEKNILLGQYDGYLEASGVAANSKTETMFFGKAFIDTSRWKGVPFYFLTGKKMDEKCSEISIKFKHGDYQDKLWANKEIPNNLLIIKIAPEDGIEFQMNTKTPGLGTNIEKASLDYCHACKAVGNLPEAYEKLLLDLYNGQTTLFARWDEIESAWEKVANLQITNNQMFTYNSYKDVQEKVQQIWKEEII